MALTLYGHPFASYTWKVLITLYETGTPFEFRVVDNAAAWAELEALWPLRKFPVLRDGEATFIESSIIMEHLARHHAGATRLLPDGDAGLPVRFLDRFFDNYVMNAMQAIVADRLRPEAERNERNVADGRKTLDAAYRYLDERLAASGWSCGESFSLADCAGAPSLFYADWVHRIDDRFARLRAYRGRLLARPSVARVVDEARPYRPLFPGGAPDRD